MSHEIRTPMNGDHRHDRAGPATRAADPRAARATSRWSQTSAEALLTLINDILDFSKIEAGKLELDRDRFDLRDSCVDDVLATLALRAREKGLSCAATSRPTCRRVVRRRPGRLRQVLVNLVGNAIKFTERAR